MSPRGGFFLKASLDAAISVFFSIYFSSIKMKHRFYSPLLSEDNYITIVYSHNGAADKTVRGTPYSVPNVKAVVSSSIKLYLFCCWDVDVDLCLCLVSETLYAELRNNLHP